MNNIISTSNDSDQTIDKLKKDLEYSFKYGNDGKYNRFILAALGSIPWIGGLLSAIAALSAENEQSEVNELQKRWIEEHQKKILELSTSMDQMLHHLDDLGPEIDQRINSPEYLSLVKRAYRSWDQTDSMEKRSLIQRVLTNAGAVSLCPDDLIRIFMDWIDNYHEAHFVVIKQIYNQQGISRGQIWDNISDMRPAENSADADLFKLLIRELNLGGIIRQYRPTNEHGDFTKQKSRIKSSSSKTLKSAFDDSEPYELTELGTRFVHYCMEDVVTRIEKG